MSLENFTEMLQVAGLISETIHRVAGLRVQVSGFGTGVSCPSVFGKRSKILHFKIIFSRFNWG